MVDVAERADENKDIVIGIVNDTEFEAWLCLWQQYISFYEADVPEHITRKTWQRFSEPEEPVFCAVARQGDQIVGLVHYLFHRSTGRKAITVTLKIFLSVRICVVNTSVRGL